MQAGAYNDTSAMDTGHWCEVIPVVKKNCGKCSRGVEKYKRGVRTVQVI